MQLTLGRVESNNERSANERKVRKKRKGEKESREKKRKTTRSPVTAEDHVKLFIY